MLALLATAAAITAAAPAAAGDRFVSGEVIVRYKSGTNAAERSASRASAGARLTRSLPIGGAQLLEARGSVEDAVDRLRRQRNVLYAQPNFLYHTAAPVPNDARFGELWGLLNFGQSVDGRPGVVGIDVRALGGWDLTRGAGVVVAIVDSGVDLGHPDLAGNAWTNNDPPGGGDNDGNGFPDDLRGWDFFDNDDDPDDENDRAPDGTPEDVYHGTHVAGTAAAVDSNSIGVAGVAPDARIMAVRVAGRSGEAASSDIGSGIAYAAREGANVINISLGGPGSSDPFISNGVSVADSADVVVVVAAGNEGSDNDQNPTVPCVLPHPNLLCVASIDNNGSLSSFSNYGPTTVDLSAPGRSILSAFGHQSPADSYHYLDGTSMSAPHVSGVAALVAGGAPAALDTQIVQAIRETVRRLPSLGGGFTVTGGIPNAAAAIQRARVLTTPPPPVPPAKASFRGSKRTIRASGTCRFSVGFRAGAGLGGRITLKTVRRVRPRKGGRRRSLTFGSKLFTVPRSGSARVRFKLSRRNCGILKRYRQLRTGVTVELRNSAGLTSTARVRITLKAPRRRR